MIDAAIQALLDQATDLTDNSSEVLPGSIFIARAGLRRHGLVGLEEAIERGASAVIHDGLAEEAELSRLKKLGVPVVCCSTLQQDLVFWLKYFWSDPAQELTLHAVTGTNGKSSIAWMLAQALGGAMIGTLGIGRPLSHHPSDLTTPSIFSVYRHLAEFKNQGIEHVVLEASSHALTQGRLQGLSFETTIFTNLGHDHLDYHGDLVAYGAAKRRLFTEFQSHHQLINIDDVFGRSLAEDLRARHGDGLAKVLSYSAESGVPSDFRVKVESVGNLLGLSVEIVLSSGESLHVQSALIGSLNAYNLAICAQVMANVGMSESDIQNGLEKILPPPGRMERVVLSKASADGESQGPEVVVDYAHSPDALRQALVMLRPLCQGQLWCVFGCGGDRDVTKRAPMGRLAEALADRVVLTDDNPRHEPSLSIIRAIQSGMRHPERARVMTERPDAIAYAISNAAPMDLVLLAGKGHETDQVIGDRRLSCDDRSIARQALARRLELQQEAC